MSDNCDSLDRALHTAAEQNSAELNRTKQNETHGGRGSYGLLKSHGENTISSDLGLE